MKCEDVRESIPLFLYGELSFDEEDGFEAHVDQCSACRSELARERRVHQSLYQAEQSITTDQLRQSRQDLMASIASMGGQRPSVWTRFRDLIGIRLHIPSAVQPIGGLALVAMGFFGARLIPQGSLGGITSASLADPIASRVRYVEPEAAGRIQIVVEETRERTLHGNLGDEGIRRLLLTAAKDPADPGLRVESMDILKSRTETTEVRDALLSALQHDSNPGVRLKALEGLKSSASDPQVRQILSRVLLADKNPGVRTQVIDLLIQQKEQPQMVGVLQELMRKEDNGYVRMRCQKALHDMKASVETF